MRTDLLPALTATQREKAIAHALKLLRKGETVALPTETVYGLAANALDPIAVAKIFEAKERPRFDPLIVHLPNREWLERVAHLTSQAREMSFTLADKFWPGPFTLVLPKRAFVPDIVTAGLDTIAVRIRLCARLGNRLLRRVQIASGKSVRRRRSMCSMNSKDASR